MKIYELKNYSIDEKSATYLGETDQKIEFGTLLKFDDKYYTCCMMNIKEDSLYVRFVDHWIPRCDDDYSDGNLMCPYCGYENPDSFELSDEDDEYVCPQCGSTLKYNREIRVYYDVKVVEEKEPLEVEFKGDRQ